MYDLITFISQSKRIGKTPTFACDADKIWAQFRGVYTVIIQRRSPVNGSVNRSS